VEQGFLEKYIVKKLPGYMKPEFHYRHGNLRVPHVFVKRDIWLSTMQDDYVGRIGNDLKT
jgi:hypothetical protein